MEGFQKTRFAGISQKLFQEWLLDPILGGFWAQVGVPKSPKTGSKTPKNHVQDSMITSNIFNRKVGGSQAKQDMRTHGPERLKGLFRGLLTT